MSSAAQKAITAGIAASMNLVLIRRKREKAPFVQLAEEAGIALFDQVRRTMQVRIK